MAPFTLIVNGEEIRQSVPPDLTLLEFLRDHLGLMGTKDGCGQGHCGACTVIMDDKATRSCLVPMKRAAGRRVETIESVARGDLLDPVQQALVSENAIQCGFCTPGLVMAVKALLRQNPNPSESEIRKALQFNICRCASYSKIVAAVRRAARLAVAPDSDSGQAVGRDPLGRSVPRKDAVSKVTGRIQYAGDMALPGMLYGKVLWSPVAHGQLGGLDTSRACIMPGVRAVLTADDVPGCDKFGLITADQPVLATDRVRFLGDALAVVIAETPQQAAAAVAEIEGDIQELPPLLDPEAALAEGAVQLHPGGNLLDHTVIRVGDVAAGMAEADVVVEGTYSVPQVEHAYLEPEATLAAPGEPGDQVLVNVWSGTHEPIKIQIQVAAALALPLEQVRVVHVPTGGAFGSKHDVLLQIFAALGALRTQRPVKMVLSRAESLRVHPKRHAVTMHYRTGARGDGTLTAVEARLVGDAGAYASESVPVMRTAIGSACGAYHVPNIALDSFAVYTNNCTAGAMRGFGIPQVIFAVEQQMDRLACQLVLDPFELRRRNALDAGKITSTGQVLREPTVFPEVIRIAQEAASNIPLPTSGKRRGFGVAAGVKPTGLGYGRDPGAAAAVELTSEGAVLARVGGVELGQGLETMVAQVAAQTLGVDYDQVQVIMGDTAQTPFGGPTIASRQTYVTGSAVLVASQGLRDLLHDLVAREFGVQRDRLLLQDGSFVDLEAEQVVCSLVDLAKVASEKGWELCQTHHYMPPETYALRVPPTDADQAHAAQADTHFSLAFSVQAAFVDVDEKTGAVDVVKLILVHDVGRAIHPGNIEGQLEGGAIMGMGYALSEEYHANGPNVTDTFGKCRVPAILNAPMVDIRLVESASMVGLSGGKAVGETAVIPTAPAIINAIHDAVGVRICELPATRKKLKAAMAQAATAGNS
jgi:CO/xanthine dehydrogenase Mo-binding subunit/aerobic-type carbon monoxide dehydrogenase small subunit (CoxS/CutS family)